MDNDNDQYRDEDGQPLMTDHGDMQLDYDPPQAEEREEDKQIMEFLELCKKNKKSEKSPAEIGCLVESVMVELEVAAEEDVELYFRNKPAINMLRKLPFLIQVLSIKQLQQEFLEHGVLCLLKNWLEPLPGWSFPDISIRSAILKILTDFPIVLERYDGREQLKKSDLGKVIMFYSNYDEETTANRKLAKDLIDKWVAEFGFEEVDFALPRP